LIRKAIALKAVKDNVLKLVLRKPFLYRMKVYEKIDIGPFYHIEFLYAGFVFG